MTQQLTPGKWRGLKQTSTGQNVFAILAFDQRGNYVKMLPEGTPYETAVQIKTEVVSALRHQRRAARPIYGLQPALRGRFEQLADGAGEERLQRRSDLPAAGLHRRLVGRQDQTHGRVAVKLLVYYH